MKKKEKYHKIYNEPPLRKLTVQDKFNRKKQLKATQFQTV